MVRVIEITSSGSSDQPGREQTEARIYFDDRPERPVRQREQPEEGPFQWHEAVARSTPVERLHSERQETIHRIEPSALPFLTDRVQHVLDHFLPIVKESGEQHGIPLDTIQILGYVDQEEEIPEIVVRLSTSIDEDSALRFWDYLGAAIEGWTDTLPENLKDIATERITFEVVPSTKPRHGI